MNTSSFAIKTTLATAAAAVLLTAAQLAGIDSLAAPRPMQAVGAEVHLPLVVVTASRADVADAMAAIVTLPTVVVTGRAERNTALAPVAAPTI